jgi:CheY-like chemotaxis protein
MTELVLETPLTIEQREYLDLVKKSADSLLSVINDVLDFSKVEAGRLDLDDVEFNLRDTLGDVLNTLAPRAHQKRIELACHVPVDVPDGVMGDPVRLGQIIMNLVGNALKFTERGEVVVDVEATARGEDEIWLHFAVSDTGIGVPADKLDMIFEAFAQADGSTTRKYGGTGLGLAIVKRLIERMGGRIWVVSDIGKGSTFHFTARFGLQKGRVVKTALVEDERMSGMPVLVVDDNATNRRILDESLTHWQMRPALAKSGPEALELLRQAARAGEPFRIALIDVQMPEMDGYTLCEHIRRDPLLASTILMILTSGGQPGDNLRRRNLQVASCLIKPVKQADLWRAIMQSLGMPLPAELSDAHSRDRVTADRRLRVLLAEDNLVNQKLAVRLLERRGHEVAIANNGSEALQKLAARTFDVVLMDVQMPEMDGYEATVRIRREEGQTGRHIRIVAMTAYAMKGDRDRCLEAGMDSYISKPVRARELFEAIESVPNPDPTNGSAVLANAKDQVFDKAAALTRVGQDEDLLRELAVVFLDESPKLMDQIRTAIANENLPALRMTAHGLKGSVDNFSAARAFDAALKLELMAQERDLSGAGAALRLLEQEVARLREALLEFTAAKVVG